MAIVAIDVVNPTGTDVTVNAKTAKARNVTKLSLDNATNEAYQFLAASCTLVSDLASSVEQKEQSGELIEVLANYIA